MATNAAIQALEGHITNLKEGMSSIPYQKEAIADLKGRLSTAKKHLAQDKKRLLEMQEALDLLKAGEEE